LASEPKAGKLQAESHTAIIAGTGTPVNANPQQSGLTIVLSG
jgi:hypothetical protein